MQLSTIQRDRAVGAILGSAAGDALGAPYEFEPARTNSQPVRMEGGGYYDWSPGEWTDDTDMAIAILQLIAAGKSLNQSETQSELVDSWAKWAKRAKDVGVQTRTILASLSEHSKAAALSLSEELHVRTGRTAGNGSLMRTGPVALGNLGSAESTAEAARSVSMLTHWDDDAGDACVLWSLAIRSAILNGELDIKVGLPFIPEARAARWLSLIDEAEGNVPSFFAHNGWVIHAFQAAWSAIYITKSTDSALFEFEADRLKFGLEQAVRAGNDTDTVAAIAGSLLGAYYGATAVPSEWRLKLHGWPDLTERDLTRMAHNAVNGGVSEGLWPNLHHFDYSSWPGRHELTQHPADPGLWLGGVGSLARLPEEVTAVVSLCRVGTGEVPQRIQKHLEVYLMDKPGDENNLNAGFLLKDVASAIALLRSQGEVVYLHCVQSQSRTPSVAASYAMQQFNLRAAEALDEIRAVLPEAQPIGYFQALLKKQEGRA